jgi:NAD(P)-dependent dehydrogenase (short-subunit alcohol dehydrogenase family)
LQDLINRLAIFFGRKWLYKKLVFIFSLIMQDNNFVPNKIALITGSTSGIGKATALELARHVGTIILPVRSLEKGNMVKTELLGINPTCTIDLYLCDLGAVSSVKTFLAGVKARYKQIDILINNAGVINYSIEKTEDKLESTFQTNVLAQYIFNKELSPLLQKSPQGRIVNVSSALYKQGKFDIDNLQGEKMKQGMRAGVQLYNNSNLERNMLTKYLADTLKYTTVTVNCLHPGVITTSLGRQNTGVLPKIFNGLFGLFTKPASQGAQTSLHLALSKEGGEVTGKYWSNSKSANGVLEKLDQDEIKSLVEYCDKLI